MFTASRGIHVETLLLKVDMSTGLQIRPQAAWYSKMPGGLGTAAVREGRRNRRVSLAERVAGPDRFQYRDQAIIWEPVLVLGEMSPIWLIPKGAAGPVQSLTANAADSEAHFNK